jgi:hypothetical protein
VLLSCPVEPRVVEKVLGTIEARAIGEKKEFGRDERRGVVAVRGDDIGDALAAPIQSRTSAVTGLLRPFYVVAKFYNPSGEVSEPVGFSQRDLLVRFLRALLKKSSRQRTPPAGTRRRDRPPRQTPPAATLEASGSRTHALERYRARAASLFSRVASARRAAENKSMYLMYSQRVSVR